jgi:hypothetical protein
MEVPAAGFIEQAVEVLKQKSQDQIRDELQELRMVSPVPASLIGGKTTDFEAGYQLGLTVIRVLIMENPTAVRAGVDI